MAAVVTAAVPISFGARPLKPDDLLGCGLFVRPMKTMLGKLRLLLWLNLKTWKSPKNLKVF